MQNFTFLVGFPSELPALELYRHCYKCSAFQVALCLLAYLSCPNFSNTKDIHMKFPGLKDTFTEKQQPNQFYTFPMCHDLIFVHFCSMGKLEHQYHGIYDSFNSKTGPL